jgi:uncharacterized protein
MILPLVLLVATLGLLGWFLKNDVGEYRLFARLARSRDRRSRYAVWIVKQLLFFAAPALIGLALLGRPGALLAMPAEFAGLAALLPPLSDPGDDREMYESILTGIGLGGVIGGVALGLVALWRRRRGQPVRIGPIGKIDHLIPRNRAELVLGAALSLSAGVTEELLFRLYLPLLLVLITGNGWIAFAVPALIFGAMHRYQGWAGMVATTLVGALFAMLYLATQSLAVAMFAHVVLDLNGLVLRPILIGAFRPASD